MVVFVCCFHTMSLVLFHRLSPVPSPYATMSQSHICQDNERNQMKPILGTLGRFPICSSIHGRPNWSCTLAVAGSLTYTQACRCRLDPDANSFWQMTLGLLDDMAVPFPVLGRDFLPFSLMIKLIFSLLPKVCESSPSSVSYSWYSGPFHSS